jgi:hypothetical protein
MTREDIIRMARDAGCLLPGKGGDPNDLWEPNGWENVTDLMFKFAALVAAHEREACRLIVLDNSDAEGICCTDDVLEAFRARGEK